jgi:hypothetical protein
MIFEKVEVTEHQFSTIKNDYDLKIMFRSGGWPSDDEQYLGMIELRLDCGNSLLTDSVNDCLRLTKEDAILQLRRAADFLESELNGE